MEITVIGAGPGGLALALALRQTEHTVRLFERDPSPEHRPQGYGIGLRGDAGLRVLDHLGLGEAVRAIGRPWGWVPFLASDGSVLLDFTLPAEALYSVPRGALRRRMTEAVGADVIRWGMRCVGFQGRGERVAARFEGGDLVESDLIVAADGVRSSLRAQLVGDRLRFLGLVSVGGMVTGGSPTSHELVTGGGFLTVGGDASLYVQTFARDGRVLWSFTRRTSDESWGRGVAFETLCERVHEHVRDWHAPAAALVQATRIEAPGAGVLAYYDRDPRVPSEPGRVALLGDAAHPMSPFQGQGANCALLDALDLAAAITRGGPVPEMVQSYHEAIRERSRRAVLDSRKAAEDFHAADAPARVRAWAQGAGG